MTRTQDEIQAIQARLQAINARETGYRPTSPTSMVEIFPATRPVATHHPGSEGNVATASEPLRQEHLTLQWPIDSSTPYPYISQNTSIADRSVSPLTERVALNQLEETWKQLTTKAEHVNQLASAQENALLELRAIAQRLERDWRATGLEEFPYPESNGDLSALYRQSSAEVPCIERSEDGTYVLTSRSLDLLRAEREALRTAQELRKRRTQSETSFLTPAGLALLKWLKGLSGGSSHTSSRSRRRTTPAMDTAPPESMSLLTAAFWLVGSTLTRIAVDMVLASNPALWLPAVALIVAPAAIAAYRTTVAPETSIQWGYRLMLIMVGLLLGGRF